MYKYLEKWVNIALILLLLQLISCSGKKEGERKSSKQVEDAASRAKMVAEKDLFFRTMSGVRVPLSQFKGRIVFLSFFATWNKASVEQLGELSRLYGKYRRHRVSVLGVSMDKNPDTVLKQFIERHGIKFPIYTNGKEVSSYFGGIGRIPTTLILMRDGTVFEVIRGKKSYKFLNDRLVDMLSHRL